MIQKIMRWMCMLVLTAGLLTTAACKGGSSGSSTLIGTYELTSAKAEGEDTNAGQFEEMQELGMKSILTLEKDGAGSLNMFGTNISITYDEGNHIIRVYDQDLEYSFENNVFSFTWEGNDLEYTKTE